MVSPKSPFLCSTVTFTQILFALVTQKEFKNITSETVFQSDKLYNLILHYLVVVALSSVCACVCALCHVRVYIYSMYITQSLRLLN